MVIKLTKCFLGIIMHCKIKYPKNEQNKSEIDICIQSLDAVYLASETFVGISVICCI